MELELRHPFSTSQQLHYICIGVLVTALLAASAGTAAADSEPGVSGQRVGADAASDIDNFWEYFFLAHLEKALHRRITQLKEDPTSIELDNDDASYLQNGRDKRKVLGVAGLDNFDVMTKTLDRTRTRNRNRLPMMMSVPRMNTSRLRMLMESQGRRRK